MSYEKDIEIDGQALDLEWLGQASLMLKYGRYSAKMQHNLEIAKQNLDIAKAEADKKIRKNPEKYDIEKVTETVVANTILIEEGYKATYEEYLSTKYEADMARAAVTACEHRKSALENLVKLYGQQYFSGPKAPYEINRDWEDKEKEKKVDVGIATHLRTKRNTENFIS